MEFSKQEYWSGLSFPFPGDLPNPGIEPGSPTLHANSLWSEPPEKPFPASRGHMMFLVYDPLPPSPKQVIAGQVLMTHLSDQLPSSHHFH